MKLSIGLYLIDCFFLDLKQELYVKDKVPIGNGLNSPALKVSSLDPNDSNKKLYNGHINVDSNRLTETETQTTLSGTPLKRTFLFIIIIRLTIVYA